MAEEICPLLDHWEQMARLREAARIAAIEGPTRVRCPTCSAEPGRVCHSGGVRVQRTHRRRVRAHQQMLVNERAAAKGKA